MLREEAARDKGYQRTRVTRKGGRRPTDRDMVPHKPAWRELGVLEGLLCRGERDITPEGRHKDCNGDLRDRGVDQGHGAHQGEYATRRQLRLRLWFPGKDGAVEGRVRACMPGQAGVGSRARDPLRPTKASEEPWSSRYADHWDPTQDGPRLLVVSDALTSTSREEPRTGT